MFKMITRCRMCGKLSETPCNFDKNTMMEIALRSTGSQRMEEDRLDNYKFKPCFPHACSNGNIGIADVIGFRKM